MASAKKKTVSAPVSVDGALLHAADAREKRERVAKRGPGLVSDFGTKPQGTTHWKCRSVSDDGTKEILKAKSKETGMVVEKWPIDELSPDTIKARWGAGRYQVEFMGGRAGKGTCVHLGWGSRVEIGDVARRAPPEPVRTAEMVAAPPSSSDPLAVMAMVRQQSEYDDQRVNAHLSGLAQLAAVLVGNNQAAAALQQTTQQNQIVQALQAFEQRIEQRIAALEGADDEDDDDDDEYDDDDEDDDDEGEEETEQDMLAKGLKLIEKYGPYIDAGLQYLSARQGGAAVATSPNGAQTPQTSLPATAT